MDKKSKQIVVLKGAAGFCDRLQVLSYCVQYCLKNDAILCVDWRDNFWGQGKLDFSDYFDLIDIETISLNDVLNKINNETKIYPAAWNYDEIKSVPNNTHDFNRFVLKFDKELEKIDRALEKKAVDKKENKGLTNNTSMLSGLNNVSKVASKLADMQSVFDRFHY
jgi:hypothetical protein